MQEIKKNISMHLKRAIEERRQTVEEFSEELSISKTAMQQYLRGDANPTIDTLVLLADGLGISVKELISSLPPGWEQAEIVLRASREIAALPLERQEVAMRLLSELVAVFSE